MRPNGQFLRFLMVGVLSTAVNYSIFYLSIKLLILDYMLANAIGYISGVLIGFYFNKSWSFKASGNSNRLLIRYIGVYLVSLMLGILILRFLVETLSLHVYLANLITIAFTTALNYLCVKYYAFR
jgi:putative flippase GtrA